VRWKYIPKENLQTYHIQRHNYLLLFSAASFALIFRKGPHHWGQMVGTIQRKRTIIDVFTSSH